MIVLRWRDTRNGDHEVTQHHHEIDKDKAYWQANVALLRFVKGEINNLRIEREEEDKEQEKTA